MIERIVKTRWTSAAVPTYNWRIEPSAVVHCTAAISASGPSRCQPLTPVIPKVMTNICDRLHICVRSLRMMGP